MKTCVVCGDEAGIDEFFTLDCGHAAMRTCLKDLIIKEINDQTRGSPQAKCPIKNCSKDIAKNQVVELLGDQLNQLYKAEEDFKNKPLNFTQSLCPDEDCGGICELILEDIKKMGGRVDYY